MFTELRFSKLLRTARTVCQASMKLRARSLTLLAVGAIVGIKSDK